MTQSAVETLEDFGPPPESVAKRWIAELDLYNQQSDRWCKRAEGIISRYRDDDRDGIIGAAPATRRYNMLWANVEVQKPILYARLPKADVQRRFKDADAVGRLACEIAERALDYGIQCTDRFDRVMKDCTEDLLLVAQGCSWQRYVPHFKQTTPRINVTPVSLSVEQTQEPEGIAADGVQVSNDSRISEPAAPNYKYADDQGNEYGLDQLQRDDNGYYVNGEPVDVVEYEEVVDDYVFYSDWGCNAGARTWDEVYAVWRRVFMTKDELRARFGKEVADKVPLDYEPKGMEKADDDTKELFKKATIYEIWDRSTRKAYWISRGYDKPLDERDDPLGLEDFFPCPRPMWLTQTNNTLTPIPDFVFYQDQDGEIQSLTQRISVVEEAIRVRGIYPANVQAVKDLLTEGGTGDMIPMDYNVLATLKISDMKSMIFFWPIEQIVAALKSMIEMRNQLIQDVYQITGLSDVLRGQGDPDETATGQELKAQYGGLRVREKQKEVQRFARDMLRIRFEIIFNHFEPSTVWLMTNAQSIPDVAKDPTRGQPVMDPMGMPTGEINEYGDLFNQSIELLRNKALRQFRVDIETDSTVAADENMEKQRVNELLTAVGGFMGQIGETVMAAPEFAAPMGELMMYAFRRYKAGNSLESAMETAIEAFTQRLSQPAPQQAPQPTPDKLIDAEIKKAELQVTAQDAAQRNQLQAAQMQQDGAIAAQDAALRQGDLALKAIALKKDPSPQAVN